MENGGSVDCLGLKDKEGISPPEQASSGTGNHIQWNSCHVESRCSVI